MTVLLTSRRKSEHVENGMHKSLHQKEVSFPVHYGDVSDG